MAPTTIRKAIGVVKDQTSIRIAQVASNMAPEMEVAVVRATSHDDYPASEKYLREILDLMSHSRGYVLACVSAVSKRLGKTRNWIVAVKALMLLHRLIDEGPPLFQEEILYATRRGTRLLNMSDFRDEAHSMSWDHSAFVRSYATYLDQRLELMLFYRKSTDAGTCGGSVGGDGADDRFGGGDNFRWAPYEYGGGDMSESVTPLRDMTLDKRVFDKMDHLQRLLDRFLGCRPTGSAKHSRMVLVALYHVVRESFQLYAAICEVLGLLFDDFFIDMEYVDCVKAFEAFDSATTQFDELVGFYNWCKDIGVVRSSEYPEVQRIATKLLETMEKFVRDMAKRPKSPQTKEEEPAPDKNEIKALPPPEN
ncbi:putative clathrin assembly protein At2g25430 [Vigna unguiculata]|uniref:putative clathrin assembly protein At2g25430 n=1 Tax=Vigna unguiculata TaxID=3917 RepID=UPI001015F381|nr:putative clathrin assembly protein At2g25430 [Vigna unguiculata]